MAFIEQEAKEKAEEIDAKVSLKSPQYLPIFWCINN